LGNKTLPPGVILKVLDKKNIQYKKSGKAFILKCPFHNDNNPSASAHPEKNTFLCFACGEKIHKKWKEKNKIQTKEKKKAITARQLADLLGISHKEWKKLVKEALSEYEKLGHVKTRGSQELTYKSKKQLHNFHQKIWEENKDVWNKKAAEYLRSRNIDPELLFKRNEIRFLGEKNIIYNKYKKWPIMIPLYSLDGKRIVNIQLKAENRETIPKSIMIPGGEITHFGLSSINPKNSPVSFVVEGSTDYLTLKSWKIKNALGLFNASKDIEKEVIDKLSKIIVVFYDYDEAGINLYAKIKNIMKQTAPNKIVLPFGIKGRSKDLNDFAVNNKNAKKIIYENIKEFIRKNQTPQRETLLTNFEKIVEEN